MKEKKVKRAKRVEMLFCPLKSRILKHSEEFLKEEEGHIKNISESGICMASETSPKKGDVLAISFMLPVSSANIFLRAEVIWSKKGVTGMSFIDVNDADREQIKKYVEGRS